jgi:hypothetical protein
MKKLKKNIDEANFSHVLTRSTCGSWAQYVELAALKVISVSSIYVRYVPGSVMGNRDRG